MECFYFDSFEAAANDIGVVKQGREIHAATGYMPLRRFDFNYPEAVLALEDTKQKVVNHSEDFGDVLASHG